VDMASTTIPAGIDSPLPRNGAPHSLKAEEQDDLFFELVREIFQRHPGESVIPLVNRYGEWLGNLVSPEQPTATADRVYAEMPAQTRRAIMKPHAEIDFNDTFTDAEVDWLLKPDSLDKSER